MPGGAPWEGSQPDNLGIRAVGTPGGMRREHVTDVRPRVKLTKEEGRNAVTLELRMVFINQSCGNLLVGERELENNSQEVLPSKKTPG